MGSAGYGNHEDAADVAAERPGVKPASDRPAAGATDRPAHPKRDERPTSPGAAPSHDEVSTPGAGALPSNSPHGGDVDPGAG
jgi:hypothetical protein